MKLQFTLPEKLYVGVQGKKAFDTTTFPLAFATPHSEKADFKKRKETVDNWVCGNAMYEVVNGLYDYSKPLPPYEGTIINNELLDGFQFDKAVSRWETSNKWFNIQDPRGFTLQISAYNLGDILLNNTISKGKLIGKFAWTRTDGMNYLVNEHHPILTTEIDNTMPNPGDLIRDRHGNEYIYHGKFHRAIIDLCEKYWNVETLAYDSDKPTYGFGKGGYTWLGSKHYAVGPDKQHMHNVLFFDKDEKPWVVLSQKVKYEGDRVALTFMRKLPKFENLGPARPYDEAIEFQRYYPASDQKHWRMAAAIFKNKEDMLKQKFTPEELLKIYRSNLWKEYRTTASDKSYEFEGEVFKI